jgi:hypothetical protein
VRGKAGARLRAVLWTLTGELLLRAYLAVVAAFAGACSSSSTSSPALAILAVDPPCPAPGGVISLVLAGGDLMTCDGGKIHAADRELMNLGVATRAPLVLSARLPPGFALVPGMEIRVACGNTTASIRWFGACPAWAGDYDAGPDRQASDLSTSCGLPIEAVLEASDRDGRPFPRDGEDFLVPLDADDFAFDASKSINVTGSEMTYTFESDCFPRVAVRSPVLVGLSAKGFWLGRRCRFSVEIVDRGCPESRSARGEGALKIVAAP